MSTTVPDSRIAVRERAACLSNARAGVLARLRELDRYVTVQELSQLLGQHRNTVRGHLDELVAGRLVTVRRATPQGRGRPALLYKVNHDAFSGEREYAQLAGLLVARLAEVDRDEGVAENLGNRWAASLVADASAQGSPVPCPIGFLRDLGFDPEVDADGHTIILRRCPLIQVSSVHPEVVCTMHSSMITGLFRERGIDVRDSSIQPHADRGRCLLTIAPGTIPSED